MYRSHTGDLAGMLDCVDDPRVRTPSDNNQAFAFHQKGKGLCHPRKYPARIGLDLLEDGLDPAPVGALSEMGHDVAHGLHSVPVF